MTINEMIKYATNNGMEILDVKELLKYELSVDSNYLVVNSKKEIEINKVKEILDAIEQIKNGKPLQYVTHNQEFMGLNFFVNEDVLIPQPDTEIIVQDAIDTIKKMSIELNRKIEVLDLCTGSGAIAISIEKYIGKKANIFASDISEKALDVAKKNEKKILNRNSIKFIKSNMFENIENKFDLIVTNPPYIKSNEIKNLAKDVQNEPRIALDGGKDGLDFYRNLRENAEKYLNKNGIFIMEIGFDQKNDVLNLFENAICKKDFAGNDREIKWIRGE